MRLLDSMSDGDQHDPGRQQRHHAITKLVQSAQAIVNQAQQTTDTTIRATLAAQYDAIRSQIDQLAGDFGINGVNLLNGDTLTVTMNETGTSTVSVTGVNDTCNGALSINASANNWTSATDIARRQPVDRGLDHLALAVAEPELEPADGPGPPGFHQGDGQHAADRRRQSDPGRFNEEGANLLALQTRQQLSTTALSLAAQADQNVLRLFQ